MSNWFAAMSRTERTTFWACFAGWALDAMDVQIYAVVMPTLIVFWHLTQAQAGTLGTAALLTSSLGGWLAGILADRFGRVRILQLTICWFACFTALSGFTQSYDQLMVTRSLQGLGFGGEWATGATLMAEVINAKARGRAVGSVQSGWGVGYGVAVLLSAIVYHFVAAEAAWRVMFFLGALPAAAALVMRRSLRDSATFQVAQKRAPGQVWEIFKAPLRRSTITASLLAAGALGGNYTTLTWLPTYLRTVQHLSVQNASGFLAVNILGSFLGYVSSAHLSDAIGRRKTFAIMAALASITVGIYMLIDLSPLTVFLVGFPLGFFQSGIVSGMGATFAELFPTRVRANGQGFSYNAGRGLGAFVPALIGVASPAMGLGPAIAVFAIGSYSIVLLTTLALPETRGRDLVSIA